MKIVVCIKQVPDTSEVKINRETNTLIREGIPSIINPFDMNALEEALLLQEQFGGEVTVISMGPPQVDNALREALSLGADRAILLSDRAFAGADTLATAYTLAAGIKKLGDFDLVFCGKQAIDGDTAQVGPEIAEYLDIPHLTYVRKINDIKLDGEMPVKMTVERLVEGGYETAATSLPALCTVVREINEPRLPSFRASLRAKDAEIIVWGAADIDVNQTRLGLPGSPTQVTKIFVPEFNREGQYFKGSPEDQAHSLLAVLSEAKIV